MLWGQSERLFYCDNGRRHGVRQVRMQFAGQVHGRERVPKGQPGSSAQQVILNQCAAGRQRLVGAVSQRTQHLRQELSRPLVGPVPRQTLSKQLLGFCGSTPVGSLFAAIAYAARFCPSKMSTAECTEQENLSLVLRQNSQ